jgi:branched-chain amino acid transport system ATP-binding protein
MAISGLDEVEQGAVAALVIEGLEVYYGASLALRGVSLAVPERGKVALLGSNGAGKTTTVRAISGLLALHGGRVSAGEIRLFGTSTLRLAPNRLVSLGCSQVPEGRKVFQQLTVEENLRVGAACRPAREVPALLQTVFELFPRLADRRRSTAGGLSGGEQQMVAIGRGLMAAPRLLLLDELSLGLAPKVIDDIFDRLDAIHRHLGTAILMVEQNARIAMDFADTSYVLNKGLVVLAGSSHKLRNDPAVRELYLGGITDLESAGIADQSSVGGRRWMD